MDNWGHNDPGDVAETYNPWESDEWLLDAIITGLIAPDLLL